MHLIDLTDTGWTNVNLLNFSYSIDRNCFSKKVKKTSGAQKLTNQNNHWKYNVNANFLSSQKLLSAMILQKK